MKKYLILALLIMQIASAYAQQLPGVSYFMYDYTRTNPGSFGNKDMICANAIWKSSYAGIPGAPVSTLVNASMPFKLFGSDHGAGVSLYQETWGNYSDIDVRVGYAYRFSLGDGKLGIGLSGGIIQRSLTPDWVSYGTTDITDDKYIPNEELEANSFGFSLGLFYRGENTYFGLSMVNAYASDVDYSKESTSSALEAYDKQKPHYFVTAGYNMQMANPAFEFKPSVQFYSDAVSVTFDINGTLVYNKKMWGGVTYRSSAAIVGMAGLCILDGLNVGYAYDFGTTKLTYESNGSHEIILNYCFKVGVEKAPQRYKSIRYL